MYKFSHTIGLILLAYKERRQVVRIPRTKLNMKIFYLLYKEGLLKGFLVSENCKGLIIFLKYIDEKPLIKGFKLISKPSRLMYFSKNKLVKFFYNYGFYIISSSDSGIAFLHHHFKLNNSNTSHIQGGILLCQLYL